MREINHWEDCEQLLKDNQAPKQLIKHLYLVSSVASEISHYMLSLGFIHNQSLVICGAGLHDMGKIIYQEELKQHGSLHEEKGKEILLEQNINPEIAQCCVAHAKWEETNKPEELFVALADKLWKGQRNNALELKIIDMVATYNKQDRWDIFSDMDLFFESIADKGSQRLEESRRY